LKENLREIEHKHLRGLSENNYEVARLLIEKFFIQYKAMLLAVYRGCLDLRFSFNSAEERMVMMKDTEGFQYLLSSMLMTPEIREKYPKARLHAEIKHRETGERR
jgi:hypothetical protein